MYRYHKNLLTAANPVTEQDHSTSSTITDIDLDDGDIDNGDTPYSRTPTHESGQSSSSESSKVIGAKFILKTRDGRNLTQFATNGVVDDAKLLVQTTLDVVKKEVMDVLQASVPDDTLSKVQSIFSDEKLNNPFCGLETQKKQERFIRENFNYVVSYTERQSEFGKGAYSYY